MVPKSEMRLSRSYMVLFSQVSCGIPNKLLELLLICIVTGRAGRKGKDEIGESYVCCEKADLEEVVQLLDADLPPVESSLTPEQRGLKR